MSKTGNNGQATADKAGQREAPPFGQSILWVPRKLASGVAPAVAADLVFAQPALKGARDHAASSPNAPVGGVFLGRVREDPANGRPWVLVETAVRARRLLPEDSSAEILWAALSEVIDPETADSVVGWYRTHARTGVYLSEEEARLHDACFAERWQCAMILAGTAEHPVGGVFQRAQTGSLSRSGYTAFHESIDPSSEFSPGWKRTFVGWSNYQTDVSVALAGKGGVSIVIPSDPEASQETQETASDGPMPGDGGADRAPATVEPSRPPEPTPAPHRKVVPGKPPVVLEASPEATASRRSRVARIERIPTVSTDVRAAPGVPAAPASSAEATTAPDLRVVPASSAEAAPGSDTGADSTEPPQVAEVERAPVPDAEGPPPRIKLAPAPGVKVTPGAEALAGPTASSGAGGEVDKEDEDWSEVQIRRSLSAVGRTLGPAGGGALPAQPQTSEAKPVELGDEGAASAPAPAPAPADPVGTVPHDPVGTTPPEAVPTGAAAVPEAKPLEARGPEPIGQVPAPPDAPVPWHVGRALPEARRADPASREPLEAEPLRPEPVPPMPNSWEPVRIEPSEGGPAAGGMKAMVGGSRRRSHIPVRAIAMAATGLIAVLGGWLVLERLGGDPDVSAREGAVPPVAAGELPITGEGDASMAGVTIGQRPLFPRTSDRPEMADAEFLRMGPELFESPTTEEADSDRSTAGGGSNGEGTGNDLEVPGAPEPVEVASPMASGNAPQRTEPENGAAEPMATPSPDAPVLEGLELDDPIVAAFEDALMIFRREVSRYDSLRIEFDDQLAGCNALNLSYRAVKEAYSRLGSRFEAARGRFAGPGLQAYRSAERQVTVIDVHYDLSDCPPPRGG